MNSLPSSEFRKQYATLTEPTIVTVNGHTLGEWRPARHVFIRDEPVRPVTVDGDRFGSPRPAPKRTK